MTADAIAKVCLYVVVDRARRDLNSEARLPLEWADLLVLRPAAAA